MAEFVSSVAAPAASRSRLPLAWLPWRLGRSERGTSSGVDEQPLRAELFTADQMAQHGKALASSHALGPGRGPDKLLPRLDSNEAALIGVCRLLTAALTFFVALGTITVLMKMVRHMSFLPFAVYRVCLGIVLLALIYSGMPLGAVN